MAAISRLVAMGRRMKTSEMFTVVFLLSSVARRFPAASPAASALASLAELHAAVGRQAKLAFGDDGLTHLQAGVNHQILIDARAGRNLARFYRAVFLHYVDEQPVLPGLHGLIRNHDRVRLRGQPQHHVDELARPRPMVAIRNPALRFFGPV